MAETPRAILDATCTYDHTMTAVLAKADDGTIWHRILPIGSAFLAQSPHWHQLPPLPPRAEPDVAVAAPGEGGPTDTERLDWLDRQGDISVRMSGIQHVWLTSGTWYSRRSLREAIDVRMRQSEQPQQERSLEDHIAWANEALAPMVPIRTVVALRDLWNAFKAAPENSPEKEMAATDLDRAFAVACGE